ncbi:MAG: hypothetical protein ACFFAS_16300 [Promethearchaeota archaeon]
MACELWKELPSLKNKSLTVGIISAYLLSFSQILYYWIIIKIHVAIGLISAFNIHFLVMCVILIFSGTIYISRNTRNDGKKIRVSF